MKTCVCGHIQEQHAKDGCKGGIWETVWVCSCEKFEPVKADKLSEESLI